MYFFVENTFSYFSIHGEIRKIEALTTLMGWFSLTAGEENGPERGQDCYVLPLTSCNLSKQCRPWSETAFCLVWSGSELLANVQYVPVQVLQITLYQQHSDVTDIYSTAMNNYYLDFRGLITLVNDNHMVNYLNLYHSLGKFSRRQTDCIFLIFPRK